MASTQQANQALLDEPFVLAGRTLRNRVAHPSMSTYMAEHGTISDRLIRYYANRAKGGAGLVVTEPFAMARHQKAASRPRLFSGQQVDAYKRLADAVESHDCRLLGQVQDQGRARHEAGRTYDAIGASRLPDDLSWSMPRELSAGEVRQLIDDFAQSSLLLQRAGFSGVELSAGHGHLFHQFFSPHANRREDEYGGDWEGRVRIVAELVTAIRQLCGSSFIIGLKLPGDDGVPGSVGPDEAAIIADLLTRPRVADYVCFAHGAHARSLELHVPDRYGPTVPYIDTMRRLRESCNGTPLMALGRITDPAEAEGILARGEAELIGLGRALIADPAWPIKARAGRSNEIRYCVSCNTCWETIISHRQPIACINNPRVAERDEVDWWPQRTRTPRRVVVVGAGVSGMECAWVAAARGHQVTVLGKGAEPGGRARLRERLPGGETISSIYDYQQVAAARAGAQLVMGVTADAQRVLALKPDIVVLATGANMHVPDWVPAEARESGMVTDLRTTMTEALRFKERQEGTAVVYDMDHSEGTYASVELLARLFTRVVLLTPRDTIATEIATVTRQGIFRRLSMAGVEIRPLTEPVWSESIEEEGALEIRNVYTGKREKVADIALLTYSTPRAPDIALLQPLRDAGVDVRLLGDAQSSHNVLAATAAGHALGNALDEISRPNQETPRMSTTTTTNIDQATAQRAAEAAAAKAREMKIPMSIAVCDAAGQLKLFVRMDGASQISMQIAQDKAYTSAATGMPTHAWHDFIKEDAPLLHGIVHTPRLVVFGGGFPIKEGDAIVGAIGISGGHYTHDMDVARAALAAIGSAI